MMVRVTIGLFVLALSALLVWLLATYDFAKLAQLSGITIAIAVVLSLLYSWLYGAGVKLILRALGQRTSVWRVFLVISGGGTASYLGNVQIGIPLRLFLFHRLLGVPYALGAASVTLESACWFGLMGIGLLLAGAPGNIAPWLTACLLAFGLLAGYRFGLPLAARLFEWLPERWMGVPLGALRRGLGDLVSALQQVRWIWLAAAVLVFSVNYAIDAVTVWLVVRNYGEHVALLDALGAIILSYLAGLVSMVPMGLGVRDVSMVALLSRSGVSPDVATTVALVQRALRTVIPLGIGLLAVNLLGLRAILVHGRAGGDAP